MAEQPLPSPGGISAATNSPNNAGSPQGQKDMATEPRSCLAVMISRAVNVQARSQSRLLAQIHNQAPKQNQVRRKRDETPSTAALWETVRQRDESGLWLPDFSKTRTINVEGFFSGVDYAPRVFDSIRRHFGINSAKFAADMGSLGAGKEGEGKSKQLFFLSENQKYIIKTIKDLELDYFVGILGDYYYHMMANKHTLICRFYGLYSVTMPKLKRTFTFVVMSNNFYSPLRIPPTYHKFDLKGSTKNRLCSEEVMESGYVGKDLNFESTIYVDPTMREEFMTQLKIDAWFLQAKNLMDYSLLLGIAPLRNGHVPPAAFDGPFCSRFQNKCGGLIARVSTPPPHGAPNQSPTVTKAVVFMGIIDILQPYSLKKQMETQMKSKASDAKDFSYSAISAVPAQPYAYRFLRYIHSWLKTTTELSSPRSFNISPKARANNRIRRMSSALM